MKVYTTGPCCLGCFALASYDHGFYCAIMDEIKFPTSGDIDDTQKRHPDCPAPTGLVSVADVLEPLDWITGQDESPLCARRKVAGAHDYAYLTPREIAEDARRELTEGASK